MIEGKLFTESGVAALREELRTLREANERLSATLLEASAELSRLKSQPYEMRRADRPDCVGIWCDKEAEILTIEEPGELSFPFLHPPYFYLGPIPVVVEQQPPKVVTINYQGKNMRAIPSDNPEYWTLLGDNGITCGVAIGKFEEVQP